MLFDFTEKRLISAKDMGRFNKAGAARIKKGLVWLLM